MLLSPGGSSSSSSRGWIFMRAFAAAAALLPSPTTAAAQLVAEDQPWVCVDRRAMASSLQACTSFSHGKCLHALMVRSNLHRDLFLGNLLISMYGRHGALAHARSVLDGMQRPNAVSCTSMISAYAQHGHEAEALRLFQQMDAMGVKPDKVCFVSALRACAGARDLSQGRAIHARIAGSVLETDAVVGTALVSMYCKCAAVEDARLVFDRMHGRDAVSWNAMVSGYSQNGHPAESLEAFRQMQQAGMAPNTSTFASVLAACANQADLGHGLLIHANTIDRCLESELVVSNALINMYSKCGALERASRVFDRMRWRSVASWNTIINAHAQRGCAESSFRLFHEMQEEGVQPNEITYATLLGVCAGTGALTETESIHERISTTEFQSDIVVGNALVCAYGKCGALRTALSVFKAMHRRDVVSWNSIIAACAENGCADEAFRLFREMQEEHVKPDGVTFINLLSACSHAGRVDEGLDCFYSMSRDYNMTPTIEHCGCMIDLLGRAGQLKLAEDFICQMKVQPDAVMWITFLDACRAHRDAGRRVHAAEQMLDSGSKGMGSQVPISKIGASEGK